MQMTKNDYNSHLHYLNGRLSSINTQNISNLSKTVNSEMPRQIVKDFTKELTTYKKDRKDIQKYESYRKMRRSCSISLYVQLHNPPHKYQSWRSSYCMCNHGNDPNTNKTLISLLLMEVTDR